MADAPVLLVGDIDPAAFASLYGTLALLGKEERARVRRRSSTGFAGM